MSSPSATSTPTKKDALVGLLDDFLGAKKEQGKYADKVRKAKAAYLELCEFTDYARLSGGRDNAKVVAKLMEDFLVEVKRIHVCVSCRLSRDRREERRKGSSRPARGRTRGRAGRGSRPSGPGSATHKPQRSSTRATTPKR